LSESTSTNLNNMPSSLEPVEFVLLLRNAKGAAAISLIKQVIDSPSVYVFGEILDHPNILALESDEGKASNPQGPTHVELLRIFAYGTFSDYQTHADKLPEIGASATKKLRLLTIASLAAKTKVIKYSDLQAQLNIESVRELEDLIIEGTNVNVLRGKLDQRSSQFEVEFAMGRDIQRSDIVTIKDTLQAWCDSCDGMLACLESQVNKANTAKQSHIAHKKKIEQKIKDTRTQLKAQQLLVDSHEDPDSRMDMDRERLRDRNKGGKMKGLRGSGKSGFWQK